MTLASAEDAAKPERILLWQNHAPVGDGTFQEADATLTVFHPARPNGTAVVICPGGGYAGLVTGGEGRGIAGWLAQHGITGAVLEYRLPKGHPYLPLIDAQRAIRLVRAKAREWSVDPSRVGIMGFSAGGHVASTAGTHFDSDVGKGATAEEPTSARPDFMVLVYPVISMGELGHAGSRANLLGKDPTPEMVTLFSNEKQVTDKTPPAFAAHALDDRTVPPENSRLFCEALKAHGVPATYLELPNGGHGLNGYKGPSWDAWQAGALKWMTEQGFLTEASPAAVQP